MFISALRRSLVTAMIQYAQLFALNRYYLPTSYCEHACYLISGCGGGERPQSQTDTGSKFSSAMQQLCNLSISQTLFLSNKLCDNFFFKSYVRMEFNETMCVEFLSHHEHDGHVYFMTFFLPLVVGWFLFGFCFSGSLQTSVCS